MVKNNVKERKIIKEKREMRFSEKRKFCYDERGFCHREREFFSLSPDKTPKAT